MSMESDTTVLPNSEPKCVKRTWKRLKSPNYERMREESKKLKHDILKSLKDYTPPPPPPNGASFEFYYLVKCIYCCDTSFKAFLAGPPGPTTYFITFQAKAKGDPSNSPAIKYFQATVSVDKVDQDKQHVVVKCRIKI
ncbi:hypothetical protein QL285_034424 [Trifolium repens]|nr:hypothetical protein QL285_034424 [Trifolium repens]